jgi:hypothetical protein
MNLVLNVRRVARSTWNAPRAFVLRPLPVFPTGADVSIQENGVKGFAFSCFLVRRDARGAIWPTLCSMQPQLLEVFMLMMIPEVLPLAAAGWAFLVWLLGGGLGLAVIVFVLLKVFGK